MPHGATLLTNEITGVPYIRLTRQDIWKLREYFAWQNVQTEEQYEGDTITVQFPKMKADAAQRLLDGWRLSHDQPRVPREERAREGKRAWAGSW